MSSIAVRQNSVYLLVIISASMYNAEHIFVSLGTCSLCWEAHLLVENDMMQTALELRDICLDTEPNPDGYPVMKAVCAFPFSADHLNLNSIFSNKTLFWRPT